MAQIDEWLDSIGLGRYAALFAEHDIDLQILPELAEPDLEKLGISLGHRKKLLKAIAALAGEAPAAPAADAGTASATVRPEAERRQLTVLFCDLVGSTELGACPRNGEIPISFQHVVLLRTDKHNMLTWAAKNPITRTGS